MGTLTSQLGDQLNLMALTAVIFSMSTGDTKGFEFSKILLLASAPVLLFAPLSGVYADRLDRKKLMIGCDVLRALLVASIPLVAGSSMIPVYVVVFLVFTINRLFLSARSAMIPQVVADEHLMGANSLLNAATMAALVLGPLGGGILVERLGYKTGFLADSATYVVSAVCVSFIATRSLAEIRRERTRAPLARRSGRAWAPGRTGRSVRLAEEAAKLGREIAAPIEEEVEVIGSAYHGLFADLKHGFSTMRGSRSVVHSTVSLSAIMFVCGFVLVVCPVFARNEMNVGTAGVGMLLSVAGVGMLTGSLVVGRFFPAAPRRAIVALAFVLAGGDIALIAGVESVQALAVGVFFLGAFIAPPMVTSDTILQEAMPAETVGKAFGFRDMIARAAFGVAGILSGIIVDVVGPRPLLLLLSALCIAYSARGHLPSRGHVDAQPPERVPPHARGRLPRGRAPEAPELPHRGAARGRGLPSDARQATRRGGQHRPRDRTAGRQPRGAGPRAAHVQELRALLDGLLPAGRGEQRPLRRARPGRWDSST